MLLPRETEIKVIEERKESIISQGGQKTDTSIFLHEIQELLDPSVKEFTPEYVVKIDIAKGKNCQFVSSIGHPGKSKSNLAVHPDFKLPSFKGLYL